VVLYELRNKSRQLEIIDLQAGTTQLITNTIGDEKSHVDLAAIKDIDWWNSESEVNEFRFLANEEINQFNWISNQIDSSYGERCVRCVKFERGSWDSAMRTLSQTGRLVIDIHGYSVANPSKFRSINVEHIEPADMAFSPQGTLLAFSINDLKRNEVHTLIYDILPKKIYTITGNTLRPTWVGGSIILSPDWQRNVVFAYDIYANIKSVRLNLSKLTRNLAKNQFLTGVTASRNEKNWVFEAKDKDRIGSQLFLTDIGCLQRQDVR
jgi:hypothetical protein